MENGNREWKMEIRFGEISTLNFITLNSIAQS